MHDEIWGECPGGLEGRQQCGPLCLGPPVAAVGRMHNFSRCLVLLAALRGFGSPLPCWDRVSKGVASLSWLLLEVAREVQRDAVMAASGGPLTRPRLTAALRRAQRQPQQLAALLDLLAAAGPQALRFAHCSLVTPASIPPPAAAAAGQQQEESPSGAAFGTHPTEEVPSPFGAAGAAAAAACSIREHALTGGPRWRPSLLQEIEELLLRETDEASLEILIAAVNSPQLLLQPFNVLQMSPPHALGTNSSSSSSSGFRGRFVQLLQPLLEPLRTLASPSEAAAETAATAAAARASASRQLEAALRCPTATGEVGASCLIALWHASLSLDVHAPALAAAAVQVSDEVLPLLPLGSVLLLLRCCCMHLTRSSITYACFPVLQQQQLVEGASFRGPLPAAGEEGPPEGPAEATRPPCMQASPAAACSLLLKAAERLSRSLSPLSILMHARMHHYGRWTGLLAASASVCMQALQVQPHQALLALEAFAHLGFCPGETTDRLLGISLLRRVPQMSPQELVMNLRGIGLLKLRDEELLQSICKELTKKARECPLLLLKEALQKLEEMRFRSPELCAELLVLRLWTQRPEFWVLKETVVLVRVRN
ncbi:hypothetical protein Esti_001562 [Eimeria stiedai]